MLGLGHALEQVGYDLLSAGREICAEPVGLADSIDQLAVVARRHGGELLDRLEQLAFALEQRRRLEDCIEPRDGRLDGRRKLDAAIGTVFLRHRVERLATQARLP